MQKFVLHVAEATRHAPSLLRFLSKKGRVPTRNYTLLLSDLPPSHARHYSIPVRSPGRDAPARPFKTLRLLDILLKESPDPTWHLVENINSPQRHHLSNALVKAGVSVDEFSHFKPVIYASSIDGSVDVLQDWGYTVTEPASEQTDELGPSTKPVPAWLVVYLAIYKVRTPAMAHGPLLGLVYSNLETIPTPLRGPLLAITMVSLARFNLLLPMRRITETFRITPLSNPDLDFNILLTAISCLPVSCIEGANQVVTLLKTMEARQLKLRSDTYRFLLGQRFVTLQLTKYLRDKMTREGFIPTADHLEAYLRVFSKHGRIHDSQKYFDAIREYAMDHNLAVPMAPDDSTESTEYTSGIPHVANTLLLRAQPDRASAFQYLVNLIRDEQKKPRPGTHSVPMMRKVRPLRWSSSRDSQISWKKTIDIFDWTTALTVAANDPTTSTEMLIALFERVHSKTAALRPIGATYNVLIRGLLARKAYAQAEEYWRKLLDTGLPIDRFSLAVGARALIRAQKPHEAFAILEYFAGKVDTKFPSQYKLFKPVILNSICMNDILISLNRIQRPDITFRLWEHMENLYGVQPNDVSLSILLEAARLSRKKDDSVAGNLALLALKNPFRRQTNLRPPETREEILHTFNRVVGDMEFGPQPYKSGIWHNTPGWLRAKKIFQQVLFGESPSLWEVRSPVGSIPPSREGMGLSNEESNEWILGDRSELLSPEGRGLYPSIVPSNKNFLLYIQLLGTGGQAGEIPLALAWMKALGIQPSRHTIANALIFWSEISMRSPMTDSWSNEPNEYNSLVTWIAEWVGKERLPEGPCFASWLRTIAQMRERYTER